MTKPRLLLIILFLLFPPFAAGALIDIPTAEVLNRYSMELDFRLYYNGGVVSRISFGVFERVNIGCSVDVDSLIGIVNPEFRQPALNLKVRLYDGSRKLPALSLGYDGQAYRYKNGEYQHKEKGAYLVSDIEALLKNMEFFFGINANSDNSGNTSRAELHGFTGATYTILKNEQRLVSLMAECDDVFKSNRLNAGIRLLPSNSLYIDLSVIDLITAEKTETAERLIKINYQGQF